MALGTGRGERGAGRGGRVGIIGLRSISCATLKKGNEPGGIRSDRLREEIGPETLFEWFDYNQEKKYIAQSGKKTELVGHAVSLPSTCVRIHTGGKKKKKGKAIRDSLEE